MADRDAFAALLGGMAVGVANAYSEKMKRERDEEDKNFDFQLRLAEHVLSDDTRYTPEEQAQMASTISEAIDVPRKHGALVIRNFFQNLQKAKVLRGQPIEALTGGGGEPVTAQQPTPALPPTAPGVGTAFQDASQPPAVGLPQPRTTVSGAPGPAVGAVGTLGGLRPPSPGATTADIQTYRANQAFLERYGAQKQIDVQHAAQLDAQAKQLTFDQRRAVIKAKPDWFTAPGSAAIFQAIGEMPAKMKAELAGTVPVYSESPEGEITPRGEIPAIAKLIQPRAIPESAQRELAAARAYRERHGLVPGQPLTGRQQEAADSEHKEATEEPTAKLLRTERAEQLTRIKGNVQAIADAIEEGTDAPDMAQLGRSGMAAEVRAELDRRGFNFKNASLDWKATVRHLQSLNSTQQLRLREQIALAKELTDPQSQNPNTLPNLYKAWKSAGWSTSFRAFNKATLATAQQLPGEPGKAAQALLTQINDLTDAIATVYMGGNTPTDKSLGLAMNNLRGNWNEETFLRAIDLLQGNLKLRENSIYTSQPVGIGGPLGGAPPQAPMMTTPSGGSRVDEYLNKKRGVQ